MEFCEQGISPALTWAVEFATNIIKSLILFGYQSPEQLFQKYSRLQSFLLFDEFLKSLEELQLLEYHPEDEQRGFFSHVVSSGNAGQSIPGMNQT